MSMALDSFWFALSFGLGFGFLLVSFDLVWLPLGLIWLPFGLLC